jgi:cysteine desulfurase
MSAATRLALTRASQSGWADPRKRYKAAGESRRLLEHARVSVAGIVARRPAEIAFVPSSPDDTIALAMRAGVSALIGPSPTSLPIRLIISEVEEVRVLRAAENLSMAPPLGTQIDLIYAPVDGTGTVSEESILDSAATGPAVVVLQAANGELGTKQPVEAIAAKLPEKSRLIVDGRYQVGRRPTPTLGDFLVADPRIWGGPPGVSLLVASGHPTPVGLPSPTSGPLGVEPTNPPVPLIVTAALSLESAARSEVQTSNELTRLLRNLVATRIDDVQVLGHHENQVGYIVMFSFLYVAADELVDKLARLGWSVASGSACTSDTHRPLHVLEAIGALTHGNLRVSLPPWTTETTIRHFAADLARIVADLREEVGASQL